MTMAKDTAVGILAGAILEKVRAHPGHSVKGEQGLSVRLARELDDPASPADAATEIEQLAVSLLRGTGVNPATVYVDNSIFAADSVDALLAALDRTNPQFAAAARQQLAI